jgi:hypothetical protein
MVAAPPKDWEQERSFHDLLYEWMDRAPWLAISLVGHAMFFLLLAVVPWHIFEKREEKIVHTTIGELEDPFVEDVPPEVVDPVEDIETPEDPVLIDSDVTEPTMDNNDSFADFPSDPADISGLKDFDALESTNFELGIGGGGGSKGGRFGDGKGRRGGGGGTEPALAAGLKWLADHQDDDGKWDADEFMKHDPSTDVCDGAGRADHDVGLTGLALLAFLGDGHTTRQGKYKNQVVKAVQWLREQQDFESGLIGEDRNTNFLYDHSIATLAMCEAYYFSKSPILASSAQNAVNYIGRARNPYSVWRYAVPAQGDNDSSVTGWMVFALKAAEESGLRVDSASFTDAIAWFDEVTDPVSGRVGYSSIGERSSRETGVNDEYPRELSEAMTAVGLLCRFFLGQDPDRNEFMTKHADLMLKTTPRWDDERGLSNDLYYWYYGSYAMYQMGGKYWRTWNKAMKPAIVDSQESAGSAQGSWEPNGPWGMVGGRVYSTAMSVLCLEVYFRYSKVLGSR